MKITSYFPYTDNLYFTLGSNDNEHEVWNDGEIEFEIDSLDGGTQYFFCNIEELRELITVWDNRQPTHPDQLELF